MARQRTTFSKLQRDRDKQARAQAKQEKRQARAEQTNASDDQPSAPADQEKILAALAALHAAYDEGGMSLDDFELRRAELTSKLHVS